MKPEHAGKEETQEPAHGDIASEARVKPSTGYVSKASKILVSSAPNNLPHTSANNSANNSADKSSHKAPVRSMTGYAEARTGAGGWQLRVSLRSVNHRFLDVRVRIPDGLEFVEPVIRQTIRGRLRRGHVDVTLHAESAGGASFEVHRDTAAAVFASGAATARGVWIIG